MYGVIKIIRDVIKGIGNVIVKVKDGIVNLYDRISRIYSIYWLIRISSTRWEKTFPLLKTISDWVGRTFEWINAINQPPMG